MSSGWAPRILMTTDAVGGVWTYAATLSAALAAFGCEIHLVCLGPRPRREQRDALGPGIHVIETDLPLEWQDPSGAGMPQARERFADLEQSIEPDLVHLNSYREATLEWTVPVLVAAHSCVFSWAIACNDRAFLSEPRWQRYYQAVSAGLDRAQMWVAPSRAFHATINEMYRPRTPGAVIWNGTAEFSGPASVKQNIVLAAGRIWDRAKNISALSEPAARLAWPVAVAGPCDPGEQPRNIGLLGELFGFALRQQMDRAAIFASPARYEPFGLSVLEAASAGCALVLSDIPTFRELWDGAAVFVDLDDATALERELGGLIADANRRSYLQRAARQRARRYAVGNMMEAYRSIYQRLLQINRLPAFPLGALA